MGLYQRCISNFEERPVITNKLLPGNCMNCHSFCQNNPKSMIFHLRGNVAGTMLFQNGNIEKLNTKTDKTISSCVYPHWHPSGKYIAFSVNKISQVFHATCDKRIEVVDSESDLVVYDIDRNALMTDSLIASKVKFETFPDFSPDGKSLLFSSAIARPMPDEYSKVRYNLCRISFDPDKGTFGDRVDTLVNEKSGISVSFPRVSFDGRYLMFTGSDYGNFSIWHKSADLYLLDMNTKHYKQLSTVNSGETESYHSWSFNSRWFILSSRRIDGLYTRLYIAYLDKNGNAGKPFLLPQKNPDFYASFLKSYNIPEFITAPFEMNPYKAEKIAHGNGKQVEFIFQRHMDAL